MSQKPRRAEILPHVHYVDLPTMMRRLNPPLLPGGFPSLLHSVSV